MMKLLCASWNRMQRAVAAHRCPHRPVRQDYVKGRRCGELLHCGRLYGPARA